MAKRRKRRQPAFPVRIVTHTVWRDARGRMVPAPARGRRFPRGQRPVKDTRNIQLDTEGKFLRVIESIKRTRVIKTSVAGTAGSVDIPIRPTEAGMIDPALARTNVFTQTKGARLVTLTLTGRNKKTGKPVKLSYTVSAAHRGWGKPLRNLLVGRLLEVMRTQGIRTMYRIEDVDWTRVDTNQRDPFTKKRVNTKSAIRQRTELTDVDIQVVIER